MAYLDIVSDLNPVDHVHVTGVSEFLILQHAVNDPASVGGGHAATFMGENNFDMPQRSLLIRDKLAGQRTLGAPARCWQRSYSLILANKYK